MVATPEQGPQRTPEEIKEVIDIPEIPPDIERDFGVTTTQQPTQVSDDNGHPLVKPTPTRVIEPPASEEELEVMSKGTPDKSRTWLGVFWRRMIKKARYFGWKLKGKGGNI